MTTYPGGLTRGQVVGWRNAVFVVFTLAGIAISSWASRLPAVRDALDIGPGQVGVLVLGIAAGSIAGLLASSHLVARIGTRAAITWGLVLAAVGLAIAGIGVSVAGSFPVAFAGLAIFGLTAAMTDVAMNVSGAANERALGRAIMPIFHAFFSFGSVIGAGLGALAELTGLPVAVHTGIVAAIMIVATLAVSRLFQSELLLGPGEEEVPADHESRTWRARLSIWADPRTLLIGLLVLGAAFAEGSANDWLAIAMVDGHGVSNATGALVFGIFVAAMTVGRLTGVFLLDRFGRVPVLRASFLLAAVGLSIMIFVPNSGVAIVGAVLWGLGASLGFPVGMSAAADDPRTATARVSAVATIGYFAFLVGPPLIGLVGEHIGVLRALLITLALAIAGIFVAGAARPTRTEPAPVDTFDDPALR